MSSGLSHDTKQRSFSGCLTVFRGSAIVTAICACTAFLLLAGNAAQRDLPRNALWEVVRNVCVPGQSEHHDPTPCLQVDLNGGIESGFAILRDPRGGSQFLLIPTTRISGIESPIVRGPNATNYFASAWEVRTNVNEALHLTLPRDDIGLAINSAVSRSHRAVTRSRRRSKRPDFRSGFNTLDVPPPFGLHLQQHEGGRDSGGLAS